MQSFDDSRIHINEDLSKAENRVNVALFGLMPQDWFREWFLGKLDLPLDSVLYPPANEHGARPDLKVEAPDGSTKAWIEVELGTNPEQIEDYRNRYDEPVKRVWGRRGNAGDLSLEEIRGFLSKRVGSLPPQTEVNVEHLRKLIQSGLDGHSKSGGKRTGSQVSVEMLDHPIVVGLKEQLGERLVLTTGRVGRGQVRGDTMKSNEDGFSLWGFSPVHKSGVAFLLNITDGKTKMNFPTKFYLESNWPHSEDTIEEYAQILNRKGLNIDNGTGWKAAGYLGPDDMVDELDDLARCLLALVDTQ